MAELNDAALGSLPALEQAVAESDRACAGLAGRREAMERDLLDWKNLLVQKVEGCYTQVLGQLLDAFDGLEGEALLNREYVSNMFWSTQQLCHSAKDALNSPDLDNLGTLKNRLRKKVSQIEAVREEDFTPKEDASEWRYSRPEIGDEVIWRLMGTFDLGPNLLDSTTVTPVTTPCQDATNLINIMPEEFQGSMPSFSCRPTGLPIVSVATRMDENLNLSPCLAIADTAADYDMESPQLIASFQSRTLSDVSRCHPVSIALGPKGELIIADKHNKKIKIFTQYGDLIREISHDDLRSPTYVAVTPENEIAVCDRKAGDIKIFSLEGECLSIVPKLFKSPAGIAFTSTGDLLVGDTGRKAVHMVSIQAAAVKATFRNFKTPIPGTGCKEEELTQLQWPHNLSVTPDDVIIVSDRACDVIQMLDSSGRAIGRFGTSGFGKGRLQNPSGVAVGENGDILVCDNGNHCLQVLTSGGQWREPLLTSAQGLQFPSAVTWLGPGRLAVCEYLSGTVKVFQLPGHGDKVTRRSIARAMSPAF